MPDPSPSTRFLTAAAMCIAAALGAAPVPAQEKLETRDRSSAAEPVNTATAFGPAGRFVLSLDADDLAEGGVRDVSRLDALAPSLIYARSGNEILFNLRGASAPVTLGDGSPTVGMFVDGTRMTRASQYGRALFDIDRIDIVKGPLGVTFGRNAFAGIVDLRSREPDMTGTYGSADASISAFNRFRADAVSNFVPTPNLAIRAAAFGEFSDGYIVNDAGPNLGTLSDGGIRVSLAWNPAARLRVLARYQYVAENGTGVGLGGNVHRCRNISQQGKTDIQGIRFLGCSNPSPGSAGAGVLPVHRVSRDFVPAIDLDQHTASLEIEAGLGGVDLASLTSFVQHGNLIGADGDSSAVGHARHWFDENDLSFSQEFRAGLGGDGPARLSGGISYAFDQTYFGTFALTHTALDPQFMRPVVAIPNSDINCMVNNPPEACLTLTGGPIANVATVIGGLEAETAFIDAHSFAVYATGELSAPAGFAGGAFDGWRVRAGIRYSLEDRTLLGDSLAEGRANPQVSVLERYRAGVLLPYAALVPTRPDEAFSVNRDAAGAVRLNRTHQNISWLAGIEYGKTRKFRARVTASSGFLIGALGADGLNAPSQQATMVEFGVESRPNDLVTLNAALHYTLYDQLLESSGAPARSQGTTDSFGVEVDTTVSPFDGLAVNAGFAWLYATHRRFSTNYPYQLLSGVPVNTAQLAGQFPSWSPQFVFGMGVSYEFDLRTVGLARFGSLTPHVHFHFSDTLSTASTFSSDPNHRQAAYSKTDLRLIWTGPNTKYRVELFVENLEASEVRSYGSTDINDIVLTSYLYPRNYGLRVSAGF